MLKSVHLVCPAGHHMASAADEKPRDFIILGIGMAMGDGTIPKTCGVCHCDIFKIVDGPEYSTKEEALAAFKENTWSERAEHLGKVGRN